MQRIKAVEAVDMSDMLCTCKTQWCIMGMLIIITLGMLYLVTNKIRITRKYYKYSLKHSRQKREFPPVGFEPDASRLPDERPNR